MYVCTYCEISLRVIGVVAIGVRGFEFIVIGLLGIVLVPLGVGAIVEVYKLISVIKLYMK